MIRALIVLLLTGAALPVLAADVQFQLSRGDQARATTNILLFDAPPNQSVWTRQTAQGILHPSTRGLQFYPLGKADDGYKVAEPTVEFGSTVLVTNMVDLLQDGQVQRWIQVADPAQPDKPLGWAVCRPPDGACSGLQPMEGTN